jgi:hypothetical protein
MAGHAAIDSVKEVIASTTKLIKEYAVLDKDATPYLKYHKLLLALY